MKIVSCISAVIYFDIVAKWGSVILWVIAKLGIGRGIFVVVGVGVGGSGVLAQHVEPSLTVATELAALYTGL